MVCTYRMQAFPSARQDSLGTAACVPGQPLPSTSSCCLFTNHYCNYNILSIECSFVLPSQISSRARGHSWASSHPRFLATEGEFLLWEWAGGQEQGPLKCRTEQCSIPVDFQSRRLTSWNRAVCVLSIKISVIFNLTFNTELREEGRKCRGGFNLCLF